MKDKFGDEQTEAWRELAVGAARNLARLVEDAERLLRLAQKELQKLDPDRD